MFRTQFKNRQNNYEVNNSVTNASKDKKDIPLKIHQFSKKSNGKKVKSIQKKMCEIFYKFKVFQLQISNCWSNYEAIKGVIKALMGKKLINSN